MALIEDLYNKLSEGGYYTKSLGEFEGQLNDPMYRKKVHNVLVRDGIEDTDFETFDLKYTPLKKKEESGLPSMESETSGSLATPEMGTQEPLEPSSSQRNITTTTTKSTQQEYKEYLWGIQNAIDSDEVLKGNLKERDYDAEIADQEWRKSMGIPLDEVELSPQEKALQGMQDASKIIKPVDEQVTDFIKYGKTNIATEEKIKAIQASEQYKKLNTDAQRTAFLLRYSGLIPSVIPMGKELEYASTIEYDDDFKYIWNPERKEWEIQRKLPEIFVTADGKKKYKPKKKLIEWFTEAIIDPAKAKFQEIERRTKGFTQEYRDKRDIQREIKESQRTAEEKFDDFISGKGSGAYPSFDVWMQENVYKSPDGSKMYTSTGEEIGMAKAYLLYNQGYWNDWNKLQSDVVKEKEAKQKTYGETKSKYFTVSKDDEKYFSNLDAQFYNDVKNATKSGDYSSLWTKYGFMVGEDNITSPGQNEFSLDSSPQEISNWLIDTWNKEKDFRVLEKKFKNNNGDLNATNKDEYENALIDMIYRNPSVYKSMMERNLALGGDMWQKISERIGLQTEDAYNVYKKSNNDLGGLIDRFNFESDFIKNKKDIAAFYREEYKKTKDELYLKGAEEAENAIKNYSFDFEKAKQEIDKKTVEVERDKYNYEQTSASLDKLSIGLEKTAAIRAIEREQSGNTFGSFVSSFMDATMGIAEAVMYVEMDLVKFAADAKTFVEPTQYNKMLENGMTPEEINNKVYGDISRFIVASKQAGVETMSSLGFMEETTPEWMSSKDRSMFQKAIGSIGGTLGSALGGTTGFIAGAAADMREQMTAEEFDNMGALEKNAYTAAYGFVMGQLEKYGFEQMKAPVNSRIITGIIGRSLTGFSKDATEEEIKREISKNIGKAIAAGAFDVAVGSAAEGGTEGTQFIFEGGMKAAINAAYNIDYFKDAPDLSTEEGRAEYVSSLAENVALGMIGGSIFSTMSNGASIVRNRKANKQANEEFIQFYNFASDKTIRALSIAEIKLAVQNGELSQEDAETKIKFINKAGQVADSIPENLSVYDKRESYNLLVEKQELEEEIAGKDEALIAGQKERIEQINNELKTISKNAIEESTKQQQEGTAEGGVVQREGVDQGQPQVGQGEGTVGETTQQETNISDSTVTGGGVQETEVIAQQPVAKEVVTEQPTVEEEVVIDKPTIATNSSQELERVKATTPEEDNGATFNLDGTVYDGAGLVVPVVSINTTVEEATPEMIADFVEQHADKIGDNETVKVGIYKFPNSNEMSIDLNVVAPESSREQAIEFGRIADQESLYDLSSGQNVKTGGTGKNPMQFSGNQFKEIAKALKEGRLPNVFDQAAPSQSSMGTVISGTDVEIDNQAKKIAKPRMTKIVANAAKAVSRILPDTKFIVHDTQDSFAAATGETNAGGYFDPKTNKIHINLEKANGKTVAHEVFHAVLINAVKTDANSAVTTKRMVEAIAKKIDNNPELKKYLDKFLSQYEENIQNEEKLAELVGVLAENYETSPESIKDVIKRWLDRIAKAFGLNPFNRNEVYDVLNTVARKTAKGKTIKQKDVKKIQKSQEEKTATKRKQAVTLMKGTENLVKYGLKKGKNITRKVGEALERRQREKYGFIEQNDRSESAKDKISNWMVDEVKYFIETMGDKSGKGWYGEKYQKALDNMSKIFPEMKSDQNARDLFTMLVAITSDGQKVLSNFKLAAFAYDYYKKNGKMPSTLPGQRTASFESNLKKINKLLSDYKGDISAIKKDLMEIKSIEDLNKERKKEGLDPLQTSWPVSFKAPFAASVFGPKLGMFYSNLSGNEAYPTLDRWWSRTFNRYRGTLIPEVKGGINNKGQRQGIDRFKELLGDVNMSDEEAILASKTHRDSYAKKGYKNGSEIEKAANTIYKIAYENLNDAPFNKTDRQFMYDSVTKALSKLNKQGYDLSIADVQAILWYFEKNLYKTLGVQANIEGISYEDAANTTFQKWKENNKSFNYNIKESEDDAGVEGADIEISEQPAPRKQKYNFDNVESSKVLRKSDKYLEDRVKKTKFRDVVNSYVRKISDRQGDIKRSINGINSLYSRRAENLLINKAGASGWANEIFKEADENIYKGLSRQLLEALDNIIYSRRMIAINENREKRREDAYKGLSNELAKELDNIIKIKRPKEIDPMSDIDAISDVEALVESEKTTKTKELNKIKKRLGEEVFNDLIKRSEMYKDPYSGLDGFNEAKARKSLDDFKNILGENIFWDLQARADEYFKVFEENLKRALDSGRISEEAYNTLKDIEYSPIRTLKYIIGEDQLTPEELDRWAKIYGVPSDVIKTLGTKNDNEIISNTRWLLMMNINSSVNKSFENKMLNAFDDAIQNATDIEKEALSEIILDNPVVGKREDGSLIYKYNFIKDRLGDRGYKEVVFFKNGVKKSIIMKKLYAEQLLDTFSVSPYSKFAGKVTAANWVRFFATGGNPIFIVGNIASDFANILFFSDVYGKFKPAGSVRLAWDFVKNFLRSSKNSLTSSKSKFRDLKREFLEHGGGMDYMASDGIRNIKSRLNKYKQVTISQKALIVAAKTLSFLGEKSEEAFRISVYEKVKNDLIKKYKKENNGLEPKGQELEDIMHEAVREAREVIDFNQGGTWAKNIDAFLPYFNVSFQSMKRARQYFQKSPVSASLSMIQAGLMSGMLMAGSLALLINGVCGDEDSEEDCNEKIKRALSSISAYEKANYHIIFTGNVDENGEFEYIRIKKLPVLSLITTFADQMTTKFFLGARGMDYDSNLFSLNSKKNPFIQALKSSSPIDFTDLKGILARNPVYSAYMAGFENYDTFRGEEIFKKPAKYKYDEINPEVEGLSDDNVHNLFKAIAPAFGLSPVRTQAALEKLITSESTNPIISLLYATANGLFVWDSEYRDTFGDVVDNLLKNTSRKLIRTTNKKISEYTEEDEAADVARDINSTTLANEQALKKEVEDLYKEGKRLTNKELEDIVKKYFEGPKVRKYKSMMISKIKKRDLDWDQLNIIYEDDPELQAFYLYEKYGKTFDEEENFEINEMFRKSGRKMSSATKYYYRNNYKLK